MIYTQRKPWRILVVVVVVKRRHIVKVALSCNLVPRIFFVIVRTRSINVIPLNRSNRVLKCDVIKIKLWNYGIFQGIMKENIQKGLLAKN